MKKFLSLMLALLMVMSLSTVAWAVPTPSEATSFTFSKSYQTTAGVAVTAAPAETLGFTVTADANNPDTTAITIEDQKVSNGNITVTVPSYSMPGKWNYTVTEAQGSTQGVTYSTTPFDVQVMVAFDAIDTNKLVATTTFTTKIDNAGGAVIDNKVTGIVNKYDSGTLTVGKEVSGNLASREQLFDIDVTFTKETDKTVGSTISYGGDKSIAPAAWTGDSVTVTVQLKDGDDVTFTNIPAGVTYTVAEKAKHAAADDANGSDASKGYKVTYTGANTNVEVAADSVNTVTVNNEKGTSVDTGITLDSLPYILLLGLAVAGLVLFAVKRRSNEA